VNEQEAIDTLSRVLEQTKIIVEDPTPTNKFTYTFLISDISKKPSKPLQILGKLMLTLATLLLGAGVAIGATGIGLLPAAATGATAVGLFATGAYLDRKGKQDNTALTEPMESLTNGFANL